MQKNKPQEKEQIHSEVLPGPKQFCLSKVKRSSDLRWTFSTRYFDDKGHKHEHSYSADTLADIESKRVNISTRIRCEGFIPCDCQCAFVADHINETTSLTS